MVTLKLILKLILYQPLFNALIFLVWLIPGHNVAWAIIVLTIIIRLILVPSSLKASRAQFRMRNLQPEIQKIQEKYKGDKQKQSQALMEFYKVNKINPLGSCLPLLIQFPILIVLYYVFINGLNTSRFDLLYSFMPRPEFINTMFLGLNLAQPDRWILPVIAGVLQYFQSRQLMPLAKQGTQDTQAMIAKQMMYLMPLFTVIIAGRLPAALPLYWIITTIFGIAQQWYVMRENPKFEILNPKLKEENTIYNPKKKSEEKESTKKHGVEITVRKKK